MGARPYENSSTVPPLGWKMFLFDTVFGMLFVVVAVVRVFFLVPTLVLVVVVVVVVVVDVFVVVVVVVVAVAVVVVVICVSFRPVGFLRSLQQMAHIDFSPL